MLSGFPYLLQEMNGLDSIPNSLRVLISGGDVLRQSYVDRLVDKVTVYNTYGPSETTVCASYYNCSNGHALEDGTYPVGKAVEGISFDLTDMDPITVTYMIGDADGDEDAGDRENGVIVQFDGFEGFCAIEPDERPCFDVDI